MGPIHDLVWLTRIEGRLTPAGTPVGDVISSVRDLGEGAFELHWFGSAAEAGAFRAGILAVGVNSIDVSIGMENVQQAVLVHRRDRDAVMVDTLERAVPLIEHVSARNRKLNVIWGNEIATLRGASRYPDSSYTAAQIGKAVDENCLPFVFKYDRWEKHPQFQDIKDAGVKSFEIVRRGDKRFLLWKMRELKTINEMGRTRSRQYRVEINEIAAQFKGRLEGNDLMFPINGDIQALLTRIIPAFSSVYDIDSNALRSETKRKVYETPRAQQVINLLADGGTVSGGTKATINPPNGKAVKITQKLLHELSSAEIIVPVEGPGLSYVLAEGIFPLDADPYEVDPEPALRPK